MQHGYILMAIDWPRQTVTVRRQLDSRVLELSIDRVIYDPKIKVLLTRHGKKSRFTQ